MSNGVSLLLVVLLLLHNRMLYKAAGSLASNLESMSTFVERHEGESMSTEIKIRNCASNYGRFQFKRPNYTHAFCIAFYRKKKSKLDSLASKRKLCLLARPLN